MGLVNLNLAAFSKIKYKAVQKSLFMMFCLLMLTQCSKADVGRLMEEYMWEKRVLLVFAPSENNASLKSQNRMLAASKPGLAERDMVIWHLIHDNYVSINRARRPNLATAPFYKYYKVNPNSYTVILLGKDGGEKLRKQSHVTSGELFSLIDAMPMRQQEMRSGSN